MSGEQQRAELFANVDELMEWKKSFQLKQSELIAWQAMVMQKIAELQQALATTLEGCSVLIETDKTIGERVDEEARRTDIVNKRLRRLEDAVKRLTSQGDRIHRKVFGGDQDENTKTN